MCSAHDSSPIKSLAAASLPEYVDTHSLLTGYLRPKELDSKFYTRIDFYTCENTHSLSQRLSCLYFQATCCADKLHCCPNGYKCDTKTVSCYQGPRRLRWFSKTPAEPLTVSIKTPAEPLTVSTKTPAEPLTVSTRTPAEPLTVSTKTPAEPLTVSTKTLQNLSL